MMLSQISVYADCQNYVRMVQRLGVSGGGPTLFLASPS